MDQLLIAPPVESQRGPDPTPAPQQNRLAHIASKLGIVGAILGFAVLVLAVNVFVMAAITPDYMPPKNSIDPFTATSLASMLPVLVGLVGLIYSIIALKVVTVRGEASVATRGLVLAILNLSLPLLIGLLFLNFGAQSAACGGG